MPPPQISCSLSPPNQVAPTFSLLDSLHQDILFHVISKTHHLYTSVCLMHSFVHPTISYFL